MTGSGLEEIVLESGICSSGSIDQVLSGKHYNRALRVHQLMAVVLDELLLDKFMVHHGFSCSTRCPLPRKHQLQLLDICCQ